jgi:molecular chaperone DnaK
MAAGHGRNLIGIDLGTTMSVLARLKPDGTPETIPDEGANPLTPSIVFLDGKLALVGRRAKVAAAVQPTKAAAYVKREMGSPAFSRTVDGHRFHPETLSAIILRKMKKAAEARLKQTVSGAVITVPAFFDESRRKSTQDAGRIAGLQVYDILNEPTAAALAYARRARQLNGDSGPIFEIPGGEMTVVVYDLGGGTFDLTVVRLKSNRFEVLATGGDRQLGGKDWDEEIVKLVAGEFKREFGLDPREDARARTNLASKAEEAKILLSDLDSTPIQFSYKGKELETTLTRAQFEELTANLLVQTRLTAESVVRREANLRWEDVDHVLLVGGSTRMPMVREMLERTAGKPPNAELDPDQVVAHGAAIHAGIVAAKAGEGELEEQVEVFNVNSHALGVAIIKNGKPVTAVLIPKNTQLPFAASRVYGLRFAGAATIRVRVLEGESPVPDHNIEIGDCRITGLPEDLPRGAPIQVRLAYEPNGLVNVMALDMTNGRFVESVIERHNGLTDADIAREAEIIKSLEIR